MSEKDRFLRNFERNKRRSRLQSQKKKRTWPRVRSFLFGIAAIFGVTIAFPSQFNSFVEAIVSLKDKTVELWLVPERWHGVFHTSPEGYVDWVDMELSRGLDLYIQLQYVSSNFGFDGELVSRNLCGMGSPYTNVLLRGHQSLLSPSEMKIEVFDVIGGQMVVLGTLQATIEPPILELDGWILDGTARLAMSPNANEIPLSRLCSQVG